MKRIIGLGFLVAGLVVAPVAALAGGAPGPSLRSFNHPGPSVLSAHPYGGPSVLGIHQGFATPGSRHHRHGHPAYVVPPRHPVWVQPQWMWSGWQWVWVPGYWAQ